MKSEIVSDNLTSCKIDGDDRQFYISKNSDTGCILCEDQIIGRRNEYCQENVIFSNELEKLLNERKSLKFKYFKIFSHIPGAEISWYQFEGKSYISSSSQADATKSKFGGSPAFGEIRETVKLDEFCEKLNFKYNLQDFSHIFMFNCNELNTTADFIDEDNFVYATYINSINIRGDKKIFDVSDLVTDLIRIDENLYDSSNEDSSLENSKDMLDRGFSKEKSELSGGALIVNYFNSEDVIIYTEKVLSSNFVLRREWMSGQNTMLIYFNHVKKYEEMREEGLIFACPTNEEIQTMYDRYLTSGELSLETKPLEGLNLLKDEDFVKRHIAERRAIFYTFFHIVPPFKKRDITKAYIIYRQTLQKLKEVITNYHKTFARKYAIFFDEKNYVKYEPDLPEDAKILPINFKQLKSGYDRIKDLCRLAENYALGKDNYYQAVIYSCSKSVLTEQGFNIYKIYKTLCFIGLMTEIQ